jgi:hypothetical protein
MPSLHARRRRWIGVFLVLVFSFCLSEALVPEACEGGFGETSVMTASGSSDEAPAERTPGHGGAHLCHCAHTNGVFSTVPPQGVVSVEHDVAPVVLTLSSPPSHTLQPDSRPPKA